VSTTYNPDPTATQAPAGPPTSDTLELTLPADGDALNAASVAQAYKVLADYVAFARAPFANPSAWTQKLLTFRDAKLNQRWCVDHFGKPQHQLIEWTESFTPASAFQTSVPGPTAAGRWMITNVGTSSGSASFYPDQLHTAPPAINGMRSPHASRQFYQVIDGGASANKCELRLGDNDYVTSVFADDTLISIEWDVSLVTLSDVLWVIGTTNYSEPVNNIQNGCFFIRPAGAGQNWHARAIVGGSQTDVDTGILADTTNHVLRIELVGASAADDSAAHAFFYIDGVQKANITSNLPVNAHIPVIPIHGGVVQAGGVNAFAISLVNSIRYSQITRLATP
jgi:hypothetical protein